MVADRSRKIRGGGIGSLKVRLHIIDIYLHKSKPILHRRPDESNFLRHISKDYNFRKARVLFPWGFKYESTR